MIVDLHGSSIPDPLRAERVDAQTTIAHYDGLKLLIMELGSKDFVDKCLVPIAKSWMRTMPARCPLDDIKLG